MVAKDIGRRRRILSAAAAVVVVLVGVVALVSWLGDRQRQSASEPSDIASPLPDPEVEEPTPSLQPEDESSGGTAAVSELSQRRAEEGEQALIGATLEIPSIEVSTSLVSLGLNEDRTMQVPSNFSQAGWYRYGPVPGRPGPAVIAGHVDSRSGPAVFYRLSELEAGDEVHVHAADGTTTFVVQRIEQHPKDAFPHAQVYGETPGPELRLITCGGVFDRSQRAHRDNLIVYATAA